MKKILFGVFAVLVLAAAAIAAEHHGGGQHMARMHEHLTRALNLTDEQQAAARQIHEEMMPRAEALMEQHRQQREELHALLDTANPNPTEVGNKAIAAHATRNQLKALHEEGMTRFKALLTEEQRTRLEEMHERHGERGLRFHHGFGHGPDHD
jgi:Spy/CpxP family protein refolding chaperone